MSYYILYKFIVGFGIAENPTTTAFERIVDKLFFVMLQWKNTKGYIVFQAT